VNSQDSVYDHTKPRQIVGTRNEEEDLGIRYDYMGPFANKQEQLISQALNSVTMPGHALQQLVRPTIPTIQMLPPRFGYRTRALGIRDVMNVDETFQPTRVDFTASQAGYQGTLRNAQDQGFW
jgi:hypothetical protein